MLYVIVVVVVVVDDDDVVFAISLICKTSSQVVSSQRSQ